MRRKRRLRTNVYTVHTVHDNMFEYRAVVDGDNTVRLGFKEPEGSELPRQENRRFTRWMGTEEFDRLTAVIRRARRLMK